MGRLERNSAFWMEDFVQRLSAPGERAMVFCAATCRTAAACMLLDQHRKFVGYYMSPEVLTAAAAKCASIYTSQRLSWKFDINGGGEVKAVAKVFKDKKATLLATEKGSMWNIPPVQSTPQVLLSCILY